MPCGFDKYYIEWSGSGMYGTSTSFTALLYEHFVLPYRTTYGLTPQLVLPLSVARFTAAGGPEHASLGVQDQESGHSSLFSLN
jgi:hypothetical protein